VNSFLVEDLGERWDDSVKRTNITPSSALPVDMKIQCDVENLVFGVVWWCFVKIPEMVLSLRFYASLKVSVASHKPSRI
jgi:hypothetical protein